MPYVVILAVVLFLELFIFNWRFFEGMNYESVSLDGFTCNSGITQTGTNELRVTGGDASIEFQNLEVEAQNIYIDVRDKRCLNTASQQNNTPPTYEKINLAIGITDDGNSYYLDMPQREVVEGVERTKYIKLHTAGESTRLKIGFSDCENQTLVLNSVVLNKQVPFHMNLVRMLICYLLLALAYILRLGSPIYKIKRLAGSRPQLGAVAALIAVNILLSGFICETNPAFIKPAWEHHQQYARLADSFINGHVYLDSVQPPQALVDMENPYDLYARNEVLSRSGGDYLWDHAYFEGKYYVYFGALPALVYYVPYKLITGQDFPTHIGISINISLFIILAFLLLDAIMKKWFKEIPFISYLLLAQVFIASSGIIFALRKPDLYAMPITMALILNMAGLYFWITFDRHKTKTMQGVCLGLGSLCMALVVGCRPQFLLFSFLAIPLFWKKLVHDRELFSKKSIAHTLAFLLPYVAVAAVAMWYNYARFGSVFDFGANYNLTTNDMTKRGANLGRVPLGLFAYFFQLPAISPRFPFVAETNLSNCYMGTTILESMFGGVLAAQPILWLIALTKFVRAELKEKRLYVFVICSAVFSVIVAIADAQMAGILNRYYMDYSYLLLLPAVLIAFVLLEKYGSRLHIPFVITCLVAACLLYDAAMLFVQCDSSHGITNPNLYYTITSAITFWL